MKSILKRLLPLIVVITITLSVTSCNLPMKNVTNAQVSSSPSTSTTPPPSISVTQSPEETKTPTPEGIGLEDIMLPVTGSILKWIDLSDFIFVPASEFSMGFDETTPSDHAPAHKVTLNGFWIQQAEVTNQQYAACVEAGKCSAPAKEKDVPYWYSKADKVNYPVVGVTWLQASEYCTFIKGRLPTEAEWEKTARGTVSFIYPWGNDKPSCSLLNFNDCLDPSEPEDVRTYNNGASEYKAMDMAGNVFEWVNDWYAEDYYPTSPATNPVGPVDGIKKVYRGGAYASSEDDVNAYVRFSVDPNEHAADLGFRCVLKGFNSDGTLDNTNASFSPPSCQVLPVNNPQLQQQPTWTPEPCGATTGFGGCSLNSQGNPITYLHLGQSNCQSNLLANFSSNSIDDLACEEYPVQNGVTYRCLGKNMFQGSTVDISFCHKYLIKQLSLDCPVGYKLDHYSKYCIPSGPWIPDPPCPNDYVEVFGICLPNKVVYGGCPNGFFESKTQIGVNPNVFLDTCIPLDDCLKKGSKKLCNAPVCPEGQTYDSTNNCCAIPEKQKQICPAGLYAAHDPVSQQLYCEKPNLFSVNCETKNIDIPFCPTQTPTPTPTIPPSSGGDIPSNGGGVVCGSFSDANTCIANGCTWGGIAFGYCY